MSRLREESGIAMVVALAVMLVVLLLGGAAVMAATQTNDIVTSDSKSKTALEAADAGLRAATYRLSVMQPDNSHCVTSSGVSLPNYPSSGSTYCYDGPPADASASLGNGS